MKTFSVKIKSYTSHTICVHFTNDNWFTDNYIMHAFDISEIVEHFEVKHQPKLFYEIEAAIDFAKHFSTYDKCIAYNEDILCDYNKLLEYRKANPILTKRKPFVPVEINIY